MESNCLLVGRIRVGMYRSKRQKLPDMQLYWLQRRPHQVALVLAAGGDGTLGEVVNGLAGRETIMGILPAGTANSFARELQMPIPGFLEMQTCDMSSGIAAGRPQGKQTTGCFRCFDDWTSASAWIWGGKSSLRGTVDIGCCGPVLAPMGI